MSEKNETRLITARKAYHTTQYLVVEVEVPAYLKDDEIEGLLLDHDMEELIEGVGDEKWTDGESELFIDPPRQDMEPVFRLVEVSVGAYILKEVSNRKVGAK